MKHRILYALRVAGDLQRVRGEVLLASSSEATTNDYLRRILESVDSLEIFPERFPEWRFDASLRMMPIEKYCVFFRVVRDTVRIVHIRYAGRKPYRQGGPANDASHCAFHEWFNSSSVPSI